MIPDRKVWVVAFSGSVVIYDANHTASYDNIEVLVDPETGDVLGETYRNPGIAPGFTLDNKTRVD